MARIPSLDARQLSPLSLREPAPGERSRSALTVSASVAAHVVVLAAVLVLPLLFDERLPEQAGAVRAFFVTPLQVQPPPPPPPPPAAGRVATRMARTPAVPRDTFQAPAEVPEQIAPEAGEDLGLEGHPGGVEGGVPGGVVGGVVGGLPDAPPPPLQPLRVGDAVKEPRKLKDVPPVYPPLALSSRLQGVVILECVVDARGHVQEARVLRSVPLLDQSALDAVRQWVYSVTLVDGVPVPVIMTVTVSFRLG